MDAIAPSSQAHCVTDALRTAVAGFDRAAPVLVLCHNDADGLSAGALFARFMRNATGLEFDVMLEGKAKDLALAKLRPDLLRYAPDLAAWFGVVPAAVRLLEEKAGLEAGQDPADDPDVGEGAVDEAA